MSAAIRLEFVAAPHDHWPHEHWVEFVRRLHDTEHAGDDTIPTPVRLGLAG